MNAGFDALQRFALADHFLFERIDAAGLGYDFDTHNILIITSGRQLSHRLRKIGRGNVKLFEVIPQSAAATDINYTLGL